jgi:phenylalanyl-tRNA synthetase beta chain
MKVSESWLRDWVDAPLSGAELAAQLTMAGLEVDQVSPVAGVFHGVVVARVCETKTHPQADRLTLCDVDAGLASRLRVVCGASNVRPGLMVALALPGAHLPGDIHIKESTLRGELSQGMLCSSSELGISDGSSGILELPVDAPLGQDLREYMALNDQVLDIDLTPNRADCLSIRGIAREVGVLNNQLLREFKVQAVSPTIDVQRSVVVSATNACPAYAIRVITGINPMAVTPLWMSERLRRAGLQRIHPVVDVANYVMLELGQPMHAFDLASLKGDIQVRFASAGESLTVLGGQTVALTEDVLVIADDHQPQAVAGVMGGDASAMQEQTVDLLLESAFFNPLSIAGVARRYGWSSEASQRFERGVDPSLYRDALEYATTLLLSIVGGHAGPVIDVRTHASYPCVANIAFNPSLVAQLTGMVIPEDQMVTFLEGLGMSVSRAQLPWVVQAPTHRFDMALAVDLVEEIIRLYGYEKLESAPMLAPLIPGVVHPVEKYTTEVALSLSHRGYHETISYSFVDPILQRELYPEAEVMSLVNPISSELSEMRVGLWPGLIASLLHNIHRQQAVVKYFETGVVFERIGASINERVAVAGILTGEKAGLSWNEPTRQYDFYDMKGDLESLFQSFKSRNMRFEAGLHPALHPGKTARIFQGDMPVGWMGVLHPRLMDAFDLSSEVMVFEMSFMPLIGNAGARYQAISKYPQIRRDLCLLVDEKVSVAAIERVVSSAVPVEQFKALKVFDQYVGESLPMGKKSIAMALILQDNHRTLVDVEINAIISAILVALDEQLNIVLRD